MSAEDEEYYEPDETSITPGCCKKMIESEAVFMSFPESFYDGDTETPPVWKIMGKVVSPYNPKVKFDGGVLAKYCPFCGKDLPEIVKVEPPGPVCKCTDGGYYCDTCGERLMGCLCLKPDKAWGPKKNKKGN